MSIMIHHPYFIMLPQSEGVLVEGVEERGEVAFACVGEDGDNCLAGIFGTFSQLHRRI